ncbi:MAG: hypothetical protein SOZ34_04420 [Clostridia bacterium]|nr:hypothetical protein [Clostridia bacterium]
MGVSYKFMDNCSYGADDINSVFSKLTTQGVSLFNYSDNDNPLLTLNEAVSSFTTSGVEYYNTKACMLSYTEPDSNNLFGTFEILPGNAFMYDGAIITIDENKYNFTDTVRSLRQISDDDIYVYFYRDIAYNTIDIKVTYDTSQLEDQNTVLLGIINSENKITDKRTFATSKIAPCSSNIVLQNKIESGADLRQVDTGAERLRYTITNVFPGAKYILGNNHLYTIQQIDTETGDELSYDSVATQLNTLYVAANRVGTDLQIWMYVSKGSVDIVFFNYIIF